jgi:hypothetical protein
VLVNDMGRALLSGFSFEDKDLETNVGPPVQWAAPEFLTEEGSARSAAGDIFGFGRMCLSVSLAEGQPHGGLEVEHDPKMHQISTKAHPLFPDVRESVVFFRTIKGLIPTRPTQEECDGVLMSDDLWSLAVDCWAMYPKERPTIDNVLERLR